jgi:hypothetical protein
MPKGQLSSNQNGGDHEREKRPASSKRFKRPGTFTVFAPIDEAFARLPTGTVENLLKPRKQNQLVAIRPSTSSLEK